MVQWTVLSPHSKAISKLMEVLLLYSHYDLCKPDCHYHIPAEEDNWLFGRRSNHVLPKNVIKKNVFLKQQNPMTVNENMSKFPTTQTGLNFLTKARGWSPKKPQAMPLGSSGLHT